MNIWKAWRTVWKACGSAPMVRKSFPPKRENNTFQIEIYVISPFTLGTFLVRIVLIRLDELFCQGGLETFYYTTPLPISS